MIRFMKNYELRDFLIKIGISSNLQGFGFIQEAVEILQKQNSHINITTVYTIIAKKYERKWLYIERTIRTAIQKAYKTNDNLKKVYTKMPSNTGFLNDLAYNFDVLKNNILI